MQTLIADLRYALRGLRRAPLFAMVAIASLALGIGANAAIFTLLDQLLLRQLPIRSADQLVMLYQQGPHMGSNMGARMHSYPLYQDLQQKADAFSEVLCRRVVEASFSVDSQTERLTAELVSGNYFTMLGVRPTIGRVFDSRSDDQVFGGHPVVVLDYRYWTRRFGRDPNVVGRKILVNDHPMTIVGVSEESFTGLDPSSAPEIRVPVLMQREMMPDRSGCTWTTGAHDGCRSSRG